MVSTASTCQDPESVPIIAASALIGVIIPYYNYNKSLLYIKASKILLFVTLFVNLVTTIIYFVYQFWWGAYASIACWIFSFSYISGITWDLYREYQAIIGQAFATIFEFIVLIISIVASENESICILTSLSAIPVFSVSFQASSLCYFAYRIHCSKYQHAETLSKVALEAENVIRLHRFNIPEEFVVKMPWRYYCGDEAAHAEVGLEFAIELARNDVEIIVATAQEMTLKYMGRNTIELKEKDDRIDNINYKRREVISDSHRMDLLRYYTLLETSSYTIMLDREKGKLPHISQRCVENELSMEVSKSDIVNDFMRILLSTPLEQHVYELNIKITGSDREEDERILLTECLSTVAFKLFAVMQSQNNWEEDALSAFSMSVQEENETADLNNYVTTSNDNTILMSPEISSSYAYLMGWILGKCLFENIPIKANLSRLFLGLAGGLMLTLSDVATYDNQFALDLREAELNDHQFHSLVNQIGNVKHSIIVVKGSEERHHAINLAHAVQLKYFEANRIKIQALQLGFKNAIPSPADYYLSTDLLCKKLVGLSEIDMEDFRQNCEFIDFHSNANIQDWFFELLEKNVKYREAVLRAATGLRCLSEKGFEGLSDGKFKQRKVPFEVKIIDGVEGQHLFGISYGLLALPSYDSKEKLDDALRILCESMRDEK